MTHSETLWRDWLDGRVPPLTPRLAPLRLGGRARTLARLRRAERDPLVQKGARVTGTALTDHPAPEPKALVLMMGSNNPPGAKGKGRMVEALRNGRRREGTDSREVS